MPTANKTFYINLGVRRVLMVLVPTSLVLFLMFTFVLWPRITPALEISAESFVIFAGFIGYMVLVCTVSVGEDGVILNRTNKLPWSDVIQAKQSRILGLPYLVVGRKKGLSWRIPLYLKNLDEFYAALHSAAPSGNALQVFAASRMDGSPK